MIITTLAQLVREFLTLQARVVGGDEVVTTPDNPLRFAATYPAIQLAETRRAPAFEGDSLPDEQRWFRLDREGYVAGQVDISKGHLLSPHTSFLTYTVAPGLTYGAKIDFQDTELDLWGNPFFGCASQDDIKAEARRLFVENGYKNNAELMPHFDLPLFHADYRNVLVQACDVLQKEQYAPNRDALSLYFTTKQLSLSFDKFYREFEPYARVGSPTPSLLTERDLSYYIPRLHEAYRAFVRGGLPALQTALGDDLAEMLREPEEIPHQEG